MDKNKLKADLNKISYEFGRKHPILGVISAIALIIVIGMVRMPWALITSVYKFVKGTLFALYEWVVDVLVEFLVELISLIMVPIVAPLYVIVYWLKRFFRKDKDVKQRKAGETDGGQSSRADTRSAAEKVSES